MNDLGLPEPCPWSVEFLAYVEGDLGSAPRFRSAEWNALDRVDLRRVAAAVRAAEAWYDACSADRIGDELRRTLEAEDRRVLDRLKDAALDVSEGTDWAAAAKTPSHAQVLKRRAE